MEDWYLDGLHQKRDSRHFPAVMVLLGTLAPPCRILLHRGRAAPLGMRFSSSLGPWELCKTENNTHFRFARDMKLGESCTKLGGDTNLSWELPTSTTLAPQIIAVTPHNKTLCYFCRTRGVLASSLGFWVEFVSLQLFASQQASCFGGEKRKSLSCLLTNQCRAESSTKLFIWLLLCCLSSSTKLNE